MHKDQKQGENREKNPDTVPPSTPQGPESNDHLVDAAYRNGPYPGDFPGEPTGEGSTVSTHHTGIAPEDRKLHPHASEEGGTGLEPAGRDPRKKDGRDRNEP